MKDIPGYEGLYAVTEDGKVWSYPKLAGKKPHGGKWLTLFYSPTGYYKANLYKDNKGTQLQVHRLVALTYLPNPENKPQVNHIDGNKINNSVSNLEWATPQENSQHSADNQLLPVGSRSIKSKLTEDVIPLIRNLRKCGISLDDLAVSFGVGLTAIHNIVYRKTWRHV